MSGIFISYRRKDAGGYAGRLHETLARRYGREIVFMDVDSIGGGVPFRKRIEDALDASDAALVLIGDAWTGPDDAGGGRRIDNEDDLVRREVAAALKHKQVTVVPVLVEGARLPKKTELPEDLSELPSLQICHLRNSEWNGDVRRICRAVDGAVAESPLRKWSKGLRRPSWAWLAGGVLVLAAVAAVLLLAGGEDGEGCRNLKIPASSRDGLAAAAGSSRPAERGSVYYGSCGSETYALASFPDGSDGIFVQSGVEWVDLGPIAAEKCDQVPRELLESWEQYDC